MYVDGFPRRLQFSLPRRALLLGTARRPTACRRRARAVDARPVRLAVDNGHRLIPALDHVHVKAGGGSTCDVERASAPTTRGRGVSVWSCDGGCYISRNGAGGGSAPLVRALRARATLDLAEAASELVPRRIDPVEPRGLRARDRIDESLGS